MVQILLIVTFVALFLRETLQQPVFEVAPWVVLTLYLGGLAMICGLMWAVVWRQGSRLDRAGSRSAVRISDGAVMASRVSAVILHVFAVLGLGWLDLVRSVIGKEVLIDELIAVAPVIVAFLFGWWAMYPIDRRLREAVLIRDLDEGRAVHPMPGRGAYVLNAFRHQAALVLVPVILIVGWTEVVGVGVSALGMAAWFPMAVVQLVGMGLVLTMMPLVLRRVWSTSKLGPGPIRERLVAMCDRQGVRVRELLVWGTHGTMINGAVMGFLGPLRYILLTDALLETLPQDQVEAVMAHELGHVKRRHMIWLGMAVISVIILARAGLDEAARRVAGDRAAQDDVQTTLAFAALGVGMLAFGYLSRRFEWQADAFAVQHLSGGGAGGTGEEPVLTPDAAAAMSGALESVARLNRIPKNKFTWRHGSIAARLRRLHALAGQRADSLVVDRQVRRLKILTALAMASAAAVIGVSVWRS